jgi:plastocyanin
VKKPAVALLVAVCLSFAAGQEPGPKPTGRVTGTIRYTGTVPPPNKIVTGDGAVILHHDLVVDPKTRGLRDVVAILEDAPAQPKLAGAKPVVIDQREMQFFPRIAAVQHGRTVRFDNSDMFNHGVSVASEIKANNVSQIAGPGMPVEFTFEHEKKPLMVGCPLHGNMRAWLFVVPHPWFAISDAEGRFTIDKIPPGKYTLLLTHADTGRRDQKKVVVAAGEETKVVMEWREKPKK